MKIAFTADLHLTSRKAHPERFHALEDVLNQMIEKRIDHLILAGDLFHSTSRNYSEFEALCQMPKYKQIHFHILPGNHDVQLKQKDMAANNITVHSKPEVKTFDLISLPFLMIPYHPEKTMGDVIASFRDDLPQGRWILIGHGDWVEGLKETNPMEPGVYMPLTRIDMESFQPASAFLGHIHKPREQDKIHYSGSPCPLEINETGKRRFLVIDTETGAAVSQLIDSDILYFNETLFILPLEDEERFLVSKIQAIIQSWNLAESQKKKTQIRIKLKGYTTDKQKLVSFVKKGFEGISFFKGEEPDLSEVYSADDPERAEIAYLVSKEIEKLEWPKGEEQPTREDILLVALHTIYGD